MGRWSWPLGSLGQSGCLQICVDLHRRRNTGFVAPARVDPSRGSGHAGVLGLDLCEESAHWKSPHFLGTIVAIAEAMVHRTFCHSRAGGNPS